MAIKFKRIYDLRVDNDLLQKDIAKILGVNKNTYPHWEAGLYEIPLQVIDKLSTYYNVSIDYLTGLTNNKETKRGKINLDLLPIRLKEIRLKNKLSQEQIGLGVEGFSQINCSRYESGKIIIPFSKLFYFAKKFNVSIDYLMGYKKEASIR